MRILRVIASVDPREGGPVEGLRLSAGAMRAMGHETEIVTLDDPGSDHVSGFPFPVHALGPTLKRYRYTPRLARWIGENAARFDAAIVHGIWNHASVGGWQGLRGSGLPYVVLTHGMLDPWFREAYPLKHWAKQAFWLLWQGKVLRDARAVLFTSEDERRLARGVFRGHTYREKVVRYGTAAPPPCSAAQERAFRASVPALGRRPYFLFLSRLHPKKGCDLLVAAFGAVAREHPEIDLVMAGPDQIGWKAALEGMAEEAGFAHRIHWPGMLTGAAKWGAYRGAEAFVLPSHGENFGLVVAEALACGTPVLVTDKVNIWREVDAAGAGLVCADREQDVRGMMLRFLERDGESRSAMQAAARLCHTAHFDIDAAARSLLAVLEDIAP